MEFIKEYSILIGWGLCALFLFVKMLQSSEWDFKLMFEKKLGNLWILFALITSPILIGIFLFKTIFLTNWKRIMILVCLFMFSCSTNEFHEEKATTHLVMLLDCNGAPVQVWRVGTYSTGPTYIRFIPEGTNEPYEIANQGFAVVPISKPK